MQEGRAADVCLGDHAHRAQRGCRNDQARAQALHRQPAASAALAAPRAWRQRWHRQRKKP